MKFIEMKRDYESGLELDALSIKYDTKKETIKSRAKRGKWKKPTKTELAEMILKTEDYLYLNGIDPIALKNELENEDNEKGELEYIKTLKYALLLHAQGSVNSVETTFIEGREKHKKVKSNPPNPRSAQMFFEVDDRLASMVDIKEYETEQEKTDRFKSYQIRKRKEREEFANRILE
jgi:hypothetical protein